MDILEALDDPNVFAPHFPNAATWRPWRAFLAALFALPMDEDALALYRECTARSQPPSAPATEAWLKIGRRGGKSRILALIAVYLATFRDWRPYLAPGERGHVLVVAADRRQARQILGYVRALLKKTPLLATLSVNDNAEDIELNNAVTIEVATASFRTIRGRTVIAALCDEIAFWRSEESSNPDVEILAAIRPAMSTVPGAMLLCASSPYSRRGVLWEAWDRHHGQDGPVLVWGAPTRTMNPSLPQSVVDEAYERDPSAAAAEYGAEFRADVERIIPREIVDAAVVPGRYELPPMPKTRYFGFCDPSGGSADAMTLAITHRDADGLIVLDAIRERRPPFSPESVVKEFAETLKAYGIREVMGDRYGGLWPRERFEEAGIRYVTSPRSKSEIYAEFLPLLNTGKVALLDNARLITQLCSLERRTARGGRDSIDHPPGGHDDVVNSVAGAATFAPALFDKIVCIGPVIVSRNDPMSYQEWIGIYGSPSPSGPIDFTNRG